MLDLRLFKTFLTVLETGTYSGAALRLDYAQSTVTKHMQLLEEAYQGAKLLRRQGNRMVPTEQGEALRRYAVQMLQLYEDSRGELASARRRTIRVGTTYALSGSYLPVAVRKIREMHPDMNVHLTNGNPRTLYGLLRSGQLDALFLMDTRRRCDGFALQTLRREPLTVTVPWDHPLAKRPEARFDDIQAERLVLTEDGCSFRRYLLEEFSARGQAPRIVMELDSIQAIQEAVLHGQGVGFMPSVLAEGFREITAVPYVGGHAELYSMIVYEPGGACTPALIEQVTASVLARFPAKSEQQKGGDGS